MTAERIRELAEKLVADYHVTDGGPLSSYVEAALREAWNEALEETLKLKPLTHDPYTHAWEQAIRSLKLPEGK